MTPLQIEMLLHYYSRADDYRDEDFSAPAVREALEGFKRDELLAADKADPPRTCYVITERGRVYVEALRAVPMPERRWVMPSMTPAACGRSARITCSASGTEAKGESDER